MKVSYARLLEEIEKRQKSSVVCKCWNCLMYRYGLSKELKKKVDGQECSERSWYPEKTISAWIVLAFFALFVIGCVDGVAVLFNCLANLHK